MSFSSELDDFLITVKELNNLSEPEYIEHKDALSALIILNYARYNSVADVFLGTAALNMLNRYVKQPNTHITYQFRIHLTNILKGIEDLNNEGSIIIGYDASQNRMLSINFERFQFSFQAINFTSQIQRLVSKNHIEWDGIRKQPCSKTIFNYALNNSHISNVTMNGESLLHLITDEVTGYDNGDYTIKNGQFVKIRNIRKSVREDDLYQKNYIRSKLYECKDRPVILLGNFERLWNKHVTFKRISPFIKQMNTVTICDHINLYRPDVEKIIDVDGLKRKERYYIIGYCERYSNDNRMGVKLAMDLGFPPLLKISEFRTIQHDLFGLCHRFDPEEYMSFSQKEIYL